VDPHANPNPSLHFNADPDPGFTLMRLWEYATTGLQTPPVLHFVSVHGPTRLYFEPLKLLNFDLIADPDPAFQSNKDLDPALENNANPDPQLWLDVNVFAEEYGYGFSISNGKGFLK
jgi:hypothetical protein